MNWSDLLAALGLAAVIEGALYALAPDSTKRAMLEFMSMPTGQRRKIALGIAVTGLFIVWLARA